MYPAMTEALAKAKEPRIYDPSKTLGENLYPNSGDLFKGRVWIMSALEIYNKKKVKDAETYSRNLSEDELSRKLVLDQDLGKLKRQLELLNLDMEKCELFTPDDENRKSYLRENMAKVKNLIIATEDKIRNIYLEPFALAVWQEGESTIHRLKCEIQIGRASCRERV